MGKVVNSPLLIARVLRGHCDRLRNFLTLFVEINFGRFCLFCLLSQIVLLFLAHFQAIIVDNFCILSLFQMLIADNFGIFSLFQVLISEILCILITFTGINCGKVVRY